MQSILEMLSSAIFPSVSQRRAGKRSYSLIVLVLGAALTFGCSAERPAAADLRFDVALEPEQPSVGETKIVVEVTDPSGNAVSGVDVRVEGNMNHAGMKPSFADLDEDAPGTYSGNIEFTMGGDWYLLITAKTPDGTTAEHKLDVRGVEAK